MIQYPQIRGYILKVHELKQILQARYNARVKLEEQLDNRVALIADGVEIYSEESGEPDRIDCRQCIEAIRKTDIAERELPAEQMRRETDTDDDPDHQQWMRSVCSGE